MYSNAINSSGGWPLLEEHIDDDRDPQVGFDEDRRMDYVWGPPEERYIDEIVLRRQEMDLPDLNNPAAPPLGEITSGSTDNIIGEAGYVFNAEHVTGQTPGLYTVRHRHYESGGGLGDAAGGPGRWLSRDPIGYVDGMNLYEYVGSRPSVHIDTDGRKKYTYKEIADMIGGCSYAMPANATPWRVQQRGLIRNEVMLCLFWQESSFDTEARSPQGYYGLGQMGEAACKDVDAAYNLEPGTCWRRQRSNDLCDQIATSIAYLHHVLTNPRDFSHDGSLRGGLRRYGPVDAGFEEYADPILRCGNCLKNAQRRDDKGNPRGVEFCPADKAQDCFDKMNEEVQRVRERRRR